MGDHKHEQSAAIQLVQRAHSQLIKLREGGLSKESVEAFLSKMKEEDLPLDVLQLALAAYVTDKMMMVGSLAEQSSLPLLALGRVAAIVLKEISKDGKEKEVLETFIELIRVNMKEYASFKDALYSRDSKLDEIKDLVSRAFSGGAVQPGDRE